MQNMIPLIIALIAVVAVLYLSYLFSRYLAVGAAKMNKPKHIKIIDRVVLGQDKMLLIVQIGDKLFLIGSATQSIHILKELEEGALSEQFPQGGRIAEESGFQALLGTILNKKGGDRL